MLEPKKTNDEIKQLKKANNEKYITTLYLIILDLHFKPY